MSDRDDNALLTAAAGGDRAAFGELYARYQERAYNLAFRVLRNSEVAEDAVQEAMLSVWQTAKAFEAKQGTVQAWVLNVVLKRSLDLWRNERRRQNREARVNAAWKSDDDVLPAERSDTLAALRKEIDHLPELECRLLACHFGAGMSHYSIAALLNMPRRSVSEKLQNTLERLRRTGLSAVVLAGPALGKHIQEALTTGHACPPRMLEKLIPRLNRPAAPGGKWYWPWPAYAAGLLLIAGMSWAVLRWRGTSAAEIPARSSSSSSALPSVQTHDIGPALDDENIWHAESALKLTRTPRRVEIHLITAERRDVAPGLGYFGGIVQAKPLDVSTGAATCSLTVTIPDHLDIAFNVAAEPLADPQQRWTLAYFDDRCICLNYTGQKVLGLARWEWGDMPGLLRVLDNYRGPSPVIGDEYMGHAQIKDLGFMGGQSRRTKVNSLLGNWLPVAKGKHVLVFSMGTTEMSAACDGTVLYQGPHYARLKFVRFGLLAAVGSTAQAADQSILIEDVHVERSAALKSR